jgi:hypothetical protein
MSDFGAEMAEIEYFLGGILFFVSYKILYVITLKNNIKNTHFNVKPLKNTHFRCKIPNLP